MSSSALEDMVFAVIACDAFIAAAGETGIPRNDDLNGEARGHRPLSFGCLHAQAGEQRGGLFVSGAQAVESAFARVCAQLPRRYRGRLLQAALLAVPSANEHGNLSPLVQNLNMYLAHSLPRNTDCPRCAR